jgi:hypothetical protein
LLRKIQGRGETGAEKAAFLVQVIDGVIVHMRGVVLFGQFANVVNGALSV